MDRPRLSKKQKIMLDYVDGFIQGQGFSPSYREIAEALGYRSIATVAEHLSNLIAMGYLRKANTSARSLEVVGEAKSAPLNLEEQIKIRLNQVDETERKIIKQAFRILNITELREMFGD